jgi:hypothetical protein
MAEETKESVPIIKISVELLIAVLVDVTVKAYLRQLTPLLPYAWMFVFGHSTWKLLRNDKVREKAKPLYILGQRKSIVISYSIVFLLGGTVFVVAWFALGRALGKPSTEIEGEKHAPSSIKSADVPESPSVPTPTKEEVPIVVNPPTVTFDRSGELYSFSVRRNLKAMCTQSRSFLGSGRYLCPLWILHLIFRNRA